MEWWLGLVVFVLGLWLGFSLPFALVVVKGLRKIADSEPSVADRIAAAGITEDEMRLDEMLESWRGGDFTTSLEEWRKKKGKEGQL